MNRRRKILVGVVVVVAALLYGLLGYQPATAGTDAPFDDAEPNGSYVSNMSLSTNGNHFVAYNMSHDASDGQTLLTAEFENVSYTTYWHENRSVMRSKSTTEQQYEEMLHLSADERLVRQNNDSMTAVVVDTDENPPGGGRGLLLSVLEYPAYEPTGTTTYEGREAVVYAAQSGWYNTENFASGRTAHKIEAASGVLLVDADTEKLLYANVTFQFVRAETWGDYILTKQLRGESPTTSVDVAIDPGSTNVTQPEWASALDE
jgi:hypothetical protein